MIVRVLARGIGEPDGVTSMLISEISPTTEKRHLCCRFHGREE
jgi:hypothetical protein